jgi:SAM-dependent methyltransferase
MGKNIHHREYEFHDRWAQRESINKIDLKAIFEGSTALEHEYILSNLCSLKGKKILDIGSGLGEASVYFALKGAKVTTADISYGMLRFGKTLAKRHKVCIEPVQVISDVLPFEDESFDIVYVSNTLHHIQKLETAIREIKRILKKDGMMVSIDPIAYNPIINIYRIMANGVRTIDEHPLTISDIKAIRKNFSNCKIKTFWLLTLVLFLNFYLIDRIHPNEDRYWKRIYLVERKIAWWFRPLARLDSIILKILPIFRWWCWNVVILARK